MQPGSRPVFLIATTAALTGLLYFTGIAIGLPFWCIAIFLFAATAAAGWWLYRLPALHATKNPRQTALAYLVLIIGIALLTNRSHYLSTKYGGWDTWGIWNYDARFLSYPHYWKQLFAVTDFAHPDYPPGLPATISFWSRLCGSHFSLLVSFIVSFLPALLIPLLIFSEVQRRSIAVAAVALLWFATDDAYLARGMDQSADTWLAFFLLCACVSLKNAGDGNKASVGPAAFFTASCMFIKNEGMLLAGVIALFNARLFLCRSNRRHALSGAALPVLVLLVFKAVYAPANDLINKHTTALLPLLLQPERYQLIGIFLLHNLELSFYIPMLAVLLYALLCIVQRRWPERLMLMLVSCLLGYMLIYVISPHHLGWHLATSQERLLHQLMPSFVYTVALRFTAVRITEALPAK